MDKRHITIVRKLIKSSLKSKSPYLDLGDCGITDFSKIPELFQCTHLETLILSGQWWDIENKGELCTSQNHEAVNKIIFFPNEFRNLSNLKRLIIGGHEDGITNINFIEKLTNLRHLYISNNKISDIRPLGYLTNLESIDIWDNPISDISVLKKLKKLTNLCLGDNPIENCNDIGYLKNLRLLEIYRIGIPDSDFLENLTDLKHLHLQNNELHNITFLNKINKLSYLQIGQNNIKDLSPIRGLNCLQILNLDNNLISDISPLKNLINLTHLSLANNQISNINPLKELSNLNFLNIDKNSIKEVPLFVFQSDMRIQTQGKASNIMEDDDLNEGLYLFDNPIESPPIEIIKQGKHSVFNWFQAIKKKLNEIKIILIGEPKAGKTSLLKRLKEDKFDKHEVQTDGINIEHIHFGSCETFKEQIFLHNLTAHFWDFGGQEIMNATHQFFLTNRCVYILVLDARKDANIALQIRQWVKRIKTTGGDSPIIIVANQIDVNLGFGFSNEFELKQEFPQIKYFIKASCDTNEGLFLLKHKLEELIPQAELFNTVIDEKWIKIKEQLQEETQNKHFLDETRFIEICNNNGLLDKDGRKNAINFLHDLGLVLHFENLNLAEYYVLDPYWITYGVYQIVTSGYAGEKKGIVNMKKLDFIVNEEEDKKKIYRPTHFRKITYTNPNQRRFLVDILNEFKLCFYMPGHNEFIIPDLLDTTEPQEVTNTIRHSRDSIKFIYEYEYLPNSIIPYIMVEAHQIICKMWRTGCVLERNDCKALISKYQNRVTIIVEGEHKKKREFMAVIRHLIDNINQKLSDKPRLLIPLPGLKTFADYEVLLRRESRGKRNYIHDEDKPTEKEFQISELLEGIPDQDEVREISKKLDIILSGNQSIKLDLGVIIDSQIELNNSFEKHFNFLSRLLKKNKIGDKIIDSIKEINENQKSEITSEIMQQIAFGFELFGDEIDVKLKNIYDDLKKTDDVEIKLNLSIPLINLLGIDLGVSLDIKNWSSKMYEKYELKLFKLMGLL